MKKTDCINGKSEKKNIKTQNKSSIPLFVEITLTYLAFINRIKCALFCLKNEIMSSRGSINSAVSLNSSELSRRISFFMSVLILTTICSLIILPAGSLSAGDFWEKQLLDAEGQIEAGNDSLLVHYKKAVSKANLGQVQRTEEFVNEKKNDNSNIEERLKEELSPFLEEAEAGSKDLLGLNYAAFFYSIEEDYEKSLKYFEQITEIDENNVWPYNYKAAILIGEFEKFDVGLDVLDAALEIEDNDYTHLLKGYAYYSQGRYVQALRSMRRGRGSLDEVEQLF